MKIHSFHQHRTNISTLYLFFLKVFYIEVSKLVLFWFQSEPQKTTGDFNNFFGNFTIYWYDFKPVVGFPTRGSKSKLAFTDSFESWKRPETAFWSYLCHQDYIEILWRSIGAKIRELHVFLVWFHTGGWISNPWFKIIKWLIPIILKVENALKLFFWHIYAIRTT